MRIWGDVLYSVGACVYVHEEVSRFIKSQNPPTFPSEHITYMHYRTLELVDPVPLF